MRRCVFFVKVLTAHAVRKPLHRKWTIFDMGKNIARDVFVIVDDLALGEAGLGVHDFVEIR